MRQKKTRDGCTVLKLTDSAGEKTTPWLVTSSLGDGDALDAALKHEGLTPVGGVAVPLIDKGKFSRCHQTLCGQFKTANWLLC